MGNYSLNNIMAHINRIDVHEKMVQNQDVSLFIYISLCFFFNRRLKMMGFIIFIHIVYIYMYNFLSLTYICQNFHFIFVN